jgi:hypothetical protein
MASERRNVAKVRENKRMKRIGGFLVLLFIVCTFLLAFEVWYNTPTLAPARAAKLYEEARAAELRNNTYARTQDARVAALGVVFVGGALILVGLAVGLSYAAITKAVTNARTIYPNQAGQMPLVRIAGPGWSGYLDPNRSPGAVTILKSPPAVPRLAARVIGELPPPQVMTPLPVSEPATVQVAAQATALGMTAGATRHPTSSRANMIGAVEAVAMPKIMTARPLPPVEDEDPDHIDRLLRLTDGEVIEGDYRRTN